MKNHKLSIGLGILTFLVVITLVAGGNVANKQIRLEQIDQNNMDLRVRRNITSIELKTLIKEGARMDSRDISEESFALLMYDAIMIQQHRGDNHSWVDKRCGGLEETSPLCYENDCLKFCLSEPVIHPKYIKTPTKKDINRIVEVITP